MVTSALISGSLERLLAMKAIDVERERYVWKGENLERSAFFVDHGPLEWEALLVSLTQRTALFASTWQTSGDASNTLSAHVGLENVDTRLLRGTPAGLREISWEVRADQTYRSPLLTTNSSSVARW